jgi:diguanylate cyclase (GGDEF)-like protein
MGVIKHLAIFMLGIYNSTLLAHDQSMDLFMDHGAKMMIIDPDTGQIHFANQQASRFYQYPLSQLLQKNIKTINQLTNEEVQRELNLAKKQQRNYFQFKHLTGGNEVKDVEVYSYPIQFKGKEMLFSVIFDITEKLRIESELKRREALSRKNMHIGIYIVLMLCGAISILTVMIYIKNKKLMYLTNYDPLTGVLNRRSIAQIYSDLQKSGNLPIAVFMIDVNNLKFVNDTFGHLAGDRLIIEVSKMLKSFKKIKTIISRVAGDEFVLMVPKADRTVVQELLRYLNDYKITIQGIQFCSSVGLHMVNDRILPYEFAFTKAEERMYNRKSMNKEALNEEIENALMSRVSETTCSSVNLQAVSEISGLVAKYAGLSKGEVLNIKEAAKLQVIGYAAEISPNKGSNFFREEAKVKWYQKHPEKGYNILTSLGRNSSIATAVFYHHENYDGSGFPKSITGADIPLASRIIALSNGIYQALQSAGFHCFDKKNYELIKCDAGTIYDPQLVELIDSQLFLNDLNDLIQKRQNV